MYLVSAIVAIYLHTKIFVSKYFGLMLTLQPVFPVEAILTSKFCHSNLPWLYRIMEHKTQKMLVLSFHAINGTGYALHRVLHSDQHEIGFDLVVVDWKKFLIGTVSALNYLHKSNVLHNDIKLDNILLDQRYESVLIDFNKGCFTNEEKSYNLSKLEKCRYASEHPQVAPGFRDGHCKQSQFSDVYAIGRIIKH